jgi:2-polyprenyl-3-methyl-5-hydroxy-6-metoxy-1,4-benzoquinol methylase
VLDFGTGSGILLPSLATAAKRIVATDIELAPSQATAAARSIKVEFVSVPDFPSWTAANPATLDCIFALDVLEHVEADELEDLSTEFRSLLRPGGRLIVSGPTETVFYKLGRALAGFKNEYHHRNIFEHRSCAGGAVAHHGAHVPSAVPAAARVRAHALRALTRAVLDIEHQRL